MKQRTEAQLRQHGRDWGEVKLGEGSIRDVEFTVQYLQLAHGARLPEILTRQHTGCPGPAVPRQLIDTDEYRILTEGYIFLRTIEHYLQMMDYRQTHTLPADPEAIAQLARRLGFRGPRAGEQFRRPLPAALRCHPRRFICGTSGVTMDQSVDLRAPDNGVPARIADVHRHLERMDPSYADRLYALKTSSSMPSWPNS